MADTIMRYSHFRVKKPQVIDLWGNCISVLCYRKMYTKTKGFKKEININVNNEYIKNNQKKFNTNVNKFFFFLI